MDFKKVTQVGGVILVLSALTMLVSILVSFPFASHFSIGTQIVAHIVTILAAGVLKVGYVTFIVGKHERGLAY